MAVLAVGASYRSSSIDLLERLSFPHQALGKAYLRLMESPAIREGVILSTCNRVEVYAEVASYHAGFVDLKRFLAESREVASEEFADPLYSHYEDDAVQHLFEVAAGLDSMVLGEPQILAQVRLAYRRASDERAAGATLSALLRGAVRTGRRVRSETSIGASPSAFIDAGVSMAEERTGSVRDAAAVVVGAGAMARLAAEHLRDRGVSDLRIVNRNPERAARLAAAVGASAGGLETLGDALARADVVVASTGAASAVIGLETVRAALGHGRDRALFVLDLAVPRDVEPAVGRLADVILVDIDGLKGRVRVGAVAAEAEIGRAHEIVAEEASRFAAWRHAARLAPLLEALQAKAADIQATELARAAPRLEGLSDRERRTVEALAQSIVAKLLHDPIARVKDGARSSGGDALARALADLFALDVRPGG